MPPRVANSYKVPLYISMCKFIFLVPVVAASSHMVHIYVHIIYVCVYALEFLLHFGNGFLSKNFTSHSASSSYIVK